MRDLVNFQNSSLPQLEAKKEAFPMLLLEREREGLGFGIGRYLKSNYSDLDLHTKKHDQDISRNNLCDK